MKIKGAVYVSKALKILHNSIFLCASKFYTLPKSVKEMRRFFQQPEIGNHMGKYKILIGEAQGALDFLEEFSPIALEVVEVFLKKIDRGALDIIWTKDVVSNYDLMQIRKEYHVRPSGPYSLSPEDLIVYSLMCKHSSKRSAIYVLSPHLKRMLLLKVKLEAFRMLEQSFGDLSLRALTLREGFKIFPHFCRILRKTHGKFKRVSPLQLNLKELLEKASQFLYTNGKFAKQLISEEVPLDLTMGIKDPVTSLPSIPFISSIVAKEELAVGRPITIEIDSFTTKAYVESSACIDSGLLFKKNVECLALMLKPVGVQYPVILVACPIKGMELNFQNTLRLDNDFPLIARAVYSSSIFENSKKEIHLPHLDIILVFWSGKLCSAYVKNRRKREETWVVIPKEPVGPSITFYPFLNQAQKRFLIRLGFKLGSD